MRSPSFEILAYESTSLGTLCLRRREMLSRPGTLVTEVTLNHEFLMSSHHTASEQALAAISLDKHPGCGLHVLVGGLGLGYTAQAALASDRVAAVEVVELLPEVIRWLTDGLIPLAAELQAEPRLTIVEGDIYARLWSPPSARLHHVILIDVDHSPEEQLAEAGNPFYTAEGFARAARHLHPHGVLGVWSYAEHTPTLDSMRQSLTDVEAHPVTYYNEHVDEEFTDWIFTGRRRDEHTV